MQATRCRGLSQVASLGCCRPLAAHRVSLPSRPRGIRLQVCSAATATSTPVKRVGQASLQGTSRKRNEDRYDIQVEGSGQAGQPLAYAGVFDGHGGYATSEWLQLKLQKYIEDNWTGFSPEEDITEAFRKADAKLLQPKGGLFGAMGERGVGGSKCGATGAVALLFQGKDGKLKLLSANVGDARIVLGRKGEAIQLSEDHVPDSENERKRIERQNPNPKMPLVRFVGGTWRVGGLLALSRAFGDAYLKGSLQFEGVAAGSDGYSSGFGVIAEPYTEVVELTKDDKWLVLASDGLFANVERGGGGGLSNQEVIDMCMAAGDSTSPDDLAEKLASAAVKAGSTDDVTVIVMNLSL